MIRVFPRTVPCTHSYDPMRPIPDVIAIDVVGLDSA